MEIKKKMKYFTELTKNSIVIMGRNTWESIPNSFKPLQDRINIIITSKDINLESFENTYKYESLVDFFQKNKIKKKIFIIGGNRLYNDIIDLKKVDTLYLTKIYDKFDCDVKFMEKSKFKKIIENFDLTNVSNFNKEFCNINKKKLIF